VLAPLPAGAFATRDRKEKRLRVLDRCSGDSQALLVELNKRHKSLLVVAGLGLVAVGVDRLLLAPGSLETQASGAADEAGGTAGAALVRVANHNPAAKLAADKLEELEPSVSKEAMRDSFVAPEAWLPAQAPGSMQAAVQRSADPRVAQAEQLARSLRLSSVALKPTGTAVINGQLLREGRDTKIKLSSGEERVVRLLSVEGPDRAANSAGRAVVQVGNARITLRIAQPGTAQAAP